MAPESLTTLDGIDHHLHQVEAVDQFGGRVLKLTADAAEHRLISRQDAVKVRRLPHAEAIAGRELGKLAGILTAIAGDRLQGLRRVVLDDRGVLLDLRRQFLDVLAERDVFRILDRDLRVSMRDGNDAKGCRDDKFLHVPKLSCPFSLLSVWHR
ncbi:hypothetical protein LZK73_33555 (plasmid) [Neorhizobium galegae]|nr:hypothetical protein LZK73_33555 [Neorhizobium galegae]